MDADVRRVVPLKEAIKRIGRRKHVHTFLSGGSMLFGADHDRSELIEKMKAYGVEESGAQASAMGHTLVIVRYPLDATRTSPLFIEAAHGSARAVAAVDPHADSNTGKPTSRDKESS